MKLSGTQICFAGDQKFRLQNDIFVLHFPGFILLNRMELPGTDKHNIAGSDSASVKINRNKSRSFFNYYNFQLGMPMERNESKIQRYGTKISIVGEF